MEAVEAAMPVTTKKPSKKQTRQLFAQRKKLRELGLISKRTNLRKKLTRSQILAINKYSDVLQGTAKIVKAPDKKSAAVFKRIFKVRDEKIIVPVEKGEKPKFDKATGNIVSKRIEYGREREKIIEAKTPAYDNVPKGKNIRYVLPLVRGRRVTRFSFLTWQELENFVYQDTLGRSFKNWAEYVEIEKVGKRVKGKRRKKNERTRRVEIRQHIDFGDDGEE